MAAPGIGCSFDVLNVVLCRYTNRVICIVDNISSAMAALPLFDLADIERCEHGINDLLTLGIRRRENVIRMGSQHTSDIILVVAYAN
eukprot:3894301-Pyramimonas_sp.AAC.1